MYFVMMNEINNLYYFVKGLRGSDKKLYAGIYDENCETIKEAVEEGADLNKVIKTSLFSENKYPLRELIVHSGGKDYLVKLLLDLGANPNYTDKSGLTLLMRSCGAESWGVNNKNIENYFDLFLDYGANVNETSSLGFTALDFAVKYNKDEHKVKRLLQKGAKVSVNTLKAIKNGIYDYYANYKTLRYAFDLCRDLNEKKHILEPEIANALDGNFEKVIEIFKSSNLSSKNKELILKLAACFADEDSFKFLKENIKLHDNDNIKSLITLASRYDNVAVIKYFLDEKNIDVNTTLGDSFGKSETMLERAIKYDNKDLVKYLLSKNAQTNWCWMDGMVKNNDIELLDILLESRLIFTKKDVFSLLDSLAFNQNLDMLKYIADNPKINTICDKKELLTNMIYKICCTLKPEDKEMISFCVLNGGKISSEALKKTFNKSFSMETVKLLIDYGADTNVLTDKSTKDNCIHICINDGYFEKVKFLVENGLEVDDKIISWSKNASSSHILEYLKDHKS